MKNIHENSTLSYKEHQEEGKQESWRRKVWDVFNEWGVPLCDSEVHEALGFPDINDIRPEITRMKQEGLLVEGKEKVKSPYTNKRVRVCVTSGLPYREKILKEDDNG